MNTVKKIALTLVGTLTSALIVMSVIDPNFASYLASNFGYAAGATFVFSPVIVFFLLVWLLFFRRKAAAGK